MITLGIDLSSQPSNTAASAIEWREGKAIASSPHTRCSDGVLDGLISKADAVGIDAPFGWPKAFTEAVAGWTLAFWNDTHRDRMRFRHTDTHVNSSLGLWPLSISSDKIAIPAMRAMALLHRFGVTDRSGDGRFYKVYPAASLCSWKLPHKGYKTSEKAALVRQTILHGLREAMPWLTVEDSYAETDHNLDALISSLTARAAATGLTILPNPDQATAAVSEGWIHLPTRYPSP